MGMNAALRDSFGFIADRQHHVPLARANINITPANALQTLFRRQRETPLPITPVSILRSMLQLDDLQALLWAWTLVGILLLFAFWTNPSEASFRPFLTDLVFRERLRLLNQDQDAAESHSQADDAAAGTSSPTTAARKSDTNAFSSLLSTASYASGPFAVTFGSKVALSVRTPPFHRKDLGLLSIVTISQSMPSRSVHAQRAEASQQSTRSAKAHGAMDCTSLFIGAFGKWWVLGYGIPDLPTTGPSSQPQPSKTGREELEENMTDVTDWGILDVRSIDPEPQSRRNSIQASNGSVQDGSFHHSSRRPSGPESNARNASPTPLATKETPSEAETEDCLSITALVSRSQTDILELQEQLAQIKSVSARACEALEVDLEDVRSRKKEEERLRSDIKTRTKALDDSKRQVESGRREAERRLKTANAARALKQASIQQRKDQVDMLHKRRAALVTKKTAHVEKRLQRSADLSAQISQAKARADKLRNEMDQLRHDMQAAEEQLQFERTHPRGVQDGDFRDQGRMDPSAHVWSPAMDYSHMGSNEAMYAHLASTPDPLVDSLARFEERNLAGQRLFGPGAHDTDASLMVNKMPTAHMDDYSDLGTSVLRNAFRRANAAAVADGREILPNAPQGIGNPSLQNASNFEAIKQAFQPTLATEEDGRRSWSAFDVWQSDIRSVGQQRTQWATGGANGSADSLPHLGSSSGFLPLDRSSSAEHSFQSQGDADQTRNMSKVKRAFRWPFRPSQVQDELV
ncbi:hypothetical protein PSEUBRA_000674 [Kalmanozyma brasiliensis GHG001]|uniref:uncharacterized protein n=1 Tax=Kalmanozyma brasiliensis (strain GHG001) TaxID=1365824 RepID=UPI00286817BC|nr:uncharacterized protein PSEUBRA_000674 [Kalmanozyma brasiliensis GHG001]EST09463.2 hypothetical protein PSEUBRA_000674 [Kalmanozyma brasiliensis GHG001]